jgi:hypothetical protein
MNDPITHLQKQTFRYYYQDGLVELAVGILFAVIGLDTWLISSAPQGTPILIAAWILLPLLTIGGIIGVQRFVKNLKEKHVHSRTGYIEYLARPNRYRWLISAAGLALVIAVLLLPYDWIQKGSVAGGTILCIILASIGAQVGLKRLIATGALALALGVAFALSPLTDNASLAATFAAEGLILILTGALVFRKYLAENPLPAEGTDD